MTALAQGQFLTPRPVHRAWGQLATLKIAEPAAGKPWVFKSPGAYLTRIVALRVLLTAEAGIATRVPGVTMNDGAGNVFYSANGDLTIIASGTSEIVVSSAYPNPGQTGDTNTNIVIPEILLPPEFTIEGTTAGLQSGDQYGPMVVLAEQIEPDPYHPLAEIAKEVHQLLLAERAIEYASGS